MIVLRRLILVLALLITSLPVAYAVQPDEVLSDPALEARARELSAQMRCLVCQNQSIDDSDAPLAKDLRVLIRDRLVKGETNEQVVDYLVSRYGEFVLLKPRLNAQTVLLWAGPFAILLLGATVLFIRRRKGALVAVPEQALSDDEKTRLKDILNQKE
jgi:cytochrome c-type biogenesis protein CcmH